MTTGKTFAWIFLLHCMTALAGCAATRVVSQHPLLQPDDKAPHARVYIMRPGTERTMGVADNVVDIELDQQHLMKLAKGQYVLVDLKPGQVTMTVSSMTSWGPYSRIKEMSRSRAFTFDEGGTYFIVISPVDGEFRGVYFLPRPVDFITARELSNHLKAVGKAGDEPISQLHG